MIRMMTRASLGRGWIHCYTRGLYANGNNAANGTKLRKKMTINRLRSRYKKNIKLTMVTAYDYPSAQICDESLVDMILVGDSVAMVVMGEEDTIGVTMDQMVHHCRAVKKGAKYSFLIGDLPFGSYNTPEQALFNASRLLKEGGMDAVKLEGGTHLVPQIRALTNMGISVIGHIGLTPQSYRRLGGFTVQGKKPLEAQALLQDALDLEEAGVTAIVLEMLPTSLAKEITSSINVPTIGIGAGPDTSGQVLVYHDILGLFDKFQPKFSKIYANLRGEISDAIKMYRDEVISGKFPLLHHSFGAPSEEMIHSCRMKCPIERKKTNIAVIGGGAMGSFFASQLSSIDSNDVSIVSEWSEHVNVINENGIRVYHDDKNAIYGTTPLRRDNLFATSPTNVVTDRKHSFDVAFILVKSRGTEAAARVAKELIKENGTVVAIQNGIGNDDIVRRIFSENGNDVQLAFGITSYGARMIEPGTVKLTGTGSTHIFLPNCSAVDSTFQSCIDELSVSGMNISIERDPEKAQLLTWRKLAINAVINPLAAVFNVSNGQLLSHTPYARAVEALACEVAEITSSKISWSGEELLREVRQVLLLTEDNQNSMLTDIRHGRTSEFTNINGEVIKMAQSLSQDAPLNNALAMLFRTLEGDSCNESSLPRTLKVYKTISHMRHYRNSLSSQPQRIGFVPTMGALHVGHLSLIRSAREQCDRVIVSIFVNPTQFGENEDFDKYPRTLESDLAFLNESGLVDAVFAPSARELYPNFNIFPGGKRDNGQTIFVVPEKVESVSAEGLSRPKFFTGVATVCMKLFNIVQPHVSFFGQKDATQVIAIKQMVRELNMPLDIAVVDTMREDDGLAMSSRNVYLSLGDRAIAPVIYRALKKARDHFGDSGERRVSKLKNIVQDELECHPSVRVLYVSAADANTSRELDVDDLCLQSTVLSVAVTIGNTRLIDNIILGQ